MRKAEFIRALENNSLSEVIKECVAKEDVNRIFALQGYLIGKPSCVQT